MSEIRTKLYKGVITVENARNVKNNIIAALNDIQLQEYGWDGGVALPVREDVVREIGQRLMETYGMDLNCLPIPTVSLTREGSVTIEFRAGKRTLRFRVKCARVVDFAALLGENSRIYGTIRLAPGQTATGYAIELDEWADWLLQGLIENG